MEKDVEEYMAKIINCKYTDYEIMEQASDVIDILNEIYSLESDINQHAVISVIHDTVNEMVAPDDPTKRPELAMQFAELQQILRGNESLLLVEASDQLEQTKGIFKRAEIKGVLKARRRVVDLVDKLESAVGLFVERYTPKEDEPGK